MAYIPFPSGCPYAIITCPGTLFTSATTGYTTISWTDMICNISNFPIGTLARLLVIWTNNSAGKTNYMQLYDQLGAAVISGSEASQVIASANIYQITSSSTFSLPAGLKSFMAQVKVSSASTMSVSGLALQIEKP